LQVFIQELVGTQTTTREVSGFFVALPVDSGQMRAPIWRALRSGPRAGLGRSPDEALALLLFAAGQAACGVRTLAAPLAGDRWLRDALRARGGAAPAAEIAKAAERASIAPKTLRVATLRIGVVMRKAGLSGGWMWALPVEAVRDQGDIEAEQPAPGLDPLSGSGSCKWRQPAQEIAL
jgi:hypothetical protein